MKIAIKIDVEDYKGFKTGLPNLLKLLDRYQIQATFFFSTGFDNSGIKIKSLFLPWVLSKQLPVRQLLSGTFLPPANFKKNFSQIMRTCLDHGHDVGLKGFDTQQWLLHAVDEQQQWTENMIRWGIENFNEIFSTEPKYFSAPGFVVNPYMFELQEKLGFKLASDTRGQNPYYPSYQDKQYNILQFPVTIPLIEEYLVHEGIGIQNVHEYVFVDSQSKTFYPNIFQIRASYEGDLWLPVVEKLIVMWKSTDAAFFTFTELFDSCDMTRIMQHDVGWAKYPPGNYQATQSIVIQ